MEAGGGEFCGDDAAAFEDEFGFGAEEKGGEFDHPFCGWEAKGHMASEADGAHEVGLGERVGGGDIDWAVEVGVGDDPVECAVEIDGVDPGHVLLAAGDGAA